MPSITEQSSTQLEIRFVGLVALAEWVTGTGNSLKCATALLPRHSAHRHYASLLVRANDLVNSPGEPDFLVDWLGTGALKGWHLIDADISFGTPQDETLTILKEGRYSLPAFAWKPDLKRSDKLVNQECFDPNNFPSRLLACRVHLQTGTAFSCEAEEPALQSWGKQRDLNLTDVIGYQTSGDTMTLKVGGKRVEFVFKPSHAASIRVVNMPAHPATHWADIYDSLTRVPERFGQAIDYHCASAYMWHQPQQGTAGASKVHRDLTTEVAR